MKKKIPLALTLCSAALSLSAHAQAPQQWKAIAFGQSTDLNFSSNVLPEKVGVNNVTIDGKTLTSEQIVSLSKPITIESRGGKHRSRVFYGTEDRPDNRKDTCLCLGKTDCRRSHTGGAGLWLPVRNRLGIAFAGCAKRPGLSGSVPVARGRPDRNLAGTDRASIPSVSGAGGIAGAGDGVR